jgi:multiple sugar transport system ATP-binding protein
VREPKLFLFDEPLSNLDAKLRVDMRTEIKRLHHRLGTTIVYVTHDQIEAMTLATKIAVMKDGIVQQFGAPQEVYDRPANTYVARFVGSPAMNIIPARLTKGPVGATAVVSLPHGQAKLPGLKLSPQSLAAKEGQNVLIGIRPEHFVLASATPNGIDVHIDVVEPTGPDTLAVFSMGGAEVLARLEPFSASEGDKLRLAIKTDKIVIFDPDTEMRLD